MKKCIVMHETDTVATALDAFSAEEEVRVLNAQMQEVDRLRIQEAIPFGHKVSLKVHEKGSCIFKYGQIIGKATREIESGHHAHIHNIISVYKLEG
ncbi:MAG: UxaA family hydrolase [Thermoplasmatales archaeon]|jgi:altronate dehydratase small subunit|nr:UxaA family hydrolase [Thermoplasmatales archaeon]